MTWTTFDANDEATWPDSMTRVLVHAAPFTETGGVDVLDHFVCELEGNQLVPTELDHEGNPLILADIIKWRPLPSPDDDVVEVPRELTANQAIRLFSIFDEAVSADWTAQMFWSEAIKPFEEKKS